MDDNIKSSEHSSEKPLQLNKVKVKMCGILVNGTSQPFTNKYLWDRFCIGNEHQPYAGIFSTLYWNVESVSIHFSRNVDEPDHRRFGDDDIVVPITNQIMN